MDKDHRGQRVKRDGTCRVNTQEMISGEKVRRSIGKSFLVEFQWKVVSGRKERCAEFAGCQGERDGGRLS